MFHLSLVVCLLRHGAGPTESAVGRSLALSLREVLLQVGGGVADDIFLCDSM